MEGWVELVPAPVLVYQKCEVGMDAARMERCQWNSAEIDLRGDQKIWWIMLAQL